MPHRLAFVRKYLSASAPRLRAWLTSKLQTTDLKSNETIADLNDVNQGV